MDHEKLECIKKHILRPNPT